MFVWFYAIHMTDLKSCDYIDRSNGFSDSVDPQQWGEGGLYTVSD